VGSANHDQTVITTKAPAVSGSPAVASGVPLARLVALQGTLMGRTFSLQTGLNSLGRDARLLSGNRILLAGDDSVSRLHATIECNGERCTIHDADSANGIFLNGARVLDARDLMNDDDLKIGDTIFRYERL
jgi:hypothetical protein